MIKYSYLIILALLIFVAITRINPYLKRLKSKIGSKKGNDYDLYIQPIVEFGLVGLFVTGITAFIILEFLKLVYSRSGLFSSFFGSEGFNPMVFLVIDFTILLVSDLTLKYMANKYMEDVPKKLDKEAYELYLSLSRNLVFSIIFILSFLFMLIIFFGSGM